jgi:hypothetical protein
MARITGRENPRCVQVSFIRANHSWLRVGSSLDLEVRVRWPSGDLGGVKVESTSRTTERRARGDRDRYTVRPKSVRFRSLYSEGRRIGVQVDIRSLRVVEGIEFRLR